MVPQELRDFEYKGFTYDWQDVGDDDCSKICHEVVCGRIRIHLDYSPYSHPSVEMLKAWIDLGCPERIGQSSLTERDLTYIRGANYKTFTFDLKSRDSDWSRAGIRLTALNAEAVIKQVANTQGWCSCDVHNLQECTAAAQALELSQLEASLEN